MANVTVKPGQTLLDISIQYLGTASAVAGLAQLNGLDMTATISAGQVLTLPDVSDKRVVKMLLEGGQVPATNLSGDLEGIEFWAIEYDNIVS